MKVRAKITSVIDRQINLQSMNSPDSPETKTIIKQNLSELLSVKVTLEIEEIEYQNLKTYQQMLQTARGVSAFSKTIEIMWSHPPC